MSVKTFGRARQQGKETFGRSLRRGQETRVEQWCAPCGGPSGAQRPASNSDALGNGIRINGGIATPSFHHPRFTVNLMGNL